MDRFVVNTPSTSSQEKKRSQLPENISAKDRARKCPEGRFHVDYGLLFCSSCNIVVDHLQMFVTLKLSHTSGMQKKCRWEASNADLTKLATSDFQLFEMRQQMIYFSCFFVFSCSNRFLNSKKWIVLFLDLIKQG